MHAIILKCSHIFHYVRTEMFEVEMVKDSEINAVIITKRVISYIRYRRFELLERGFKIDARKMVTFETGKDTTLVIFVASRRYTDETFVKLASEVHIADPVNKTDEVRLYVNTQNPLLTF